SGPPVSTWLLVFVMLATNWPRVPLMPSAKTPIDPMLASHRTGENRRLRSGLRSGSFFFVVVGMWNCSPSCHALRHVFVHLLLMIPFSHQIAVNLIAIGCETVPACEIDPVVNVKTHVRA